jgi:hypothetical protein
MQKPRIRDEIISYVAPYTRLSPSNYALVFGTRHGVDEFVGDIRKLYRRGYFEHLIISGGATGGGEDTEAAVIQNALIEQGFDARKIIIEDKARNTGENVIFTKELMRDIKISELLLIGKICSKRRYMMTVKKQWPGIKNIICHGVNYFACDARQWWRDKNFRTRVINEARKIPTYAARQFITEIEIVDGIVR